MQQSDLKELVTLMDLVTLHVGSVSHEDVVTSIRPAMEKLQWIILHKGDLNGERLNPSYIAQLIVEQINVERFSEECETRYNEKRRAAEADAPQLTIPLYQKIVLNAIGGK